MKLSKAIKYVAMGSALAVVPGLALAQPPTFGQFAVDGSNNVTNDGGACGTALVTGDGFAQFDCGGGNFRTVIVEQEELDPTGSPGVLTTTFSSEVFVGADGLAVNDAILGVGDSRILQDSYLTGVDNSGVSITDAAFVGEQSFNIIAGVGTFNFRDAGAANADINGNTNAVHFDQQLGGSAGGAQYLSLDAEGEFLEISGRDDFQLKRATPALAAPGTVDGGTTDFWVAGDSVQYAAFQSAVGGANSAIAWSEFQNLTTDPEGDATAGGTVLGGDSTDWVTYSPDPFYDFVANDPFN